MVIGIGSAQLAPVWDQRETGSNEHADNMIAAYFIGTGFRVSSQSTYENYRLFNPNHILKFGK
jgi:hypothetical protein